MEEKKVHYTAFGNPTHAGVWILPEGKDIEYIVIDHIEVKLGERVRDKIIDTIVAVFKPNPYTTLDMVLNLENKNTLLKLAHKGNWEILTIKDFPVRLTYKPTSVGDGLRFSKLPPKLPTITTPTTPTNPSPKPAITDENFDKAKKFLETGTMEALKGFYEVSEEMEKKLLATPEIPI
jgi:hypothetical protein